MGNRAVITTPNNKIGIYVHWNGGIESVLGFCNAAKALGVRAPTNDPEYFLSRLTQVIANFFGGTTSVGIGLVNKLDSSDNGVWVVHDFNDIRQGSRVFSTEQLATDDLEKCNAICEQILGQQSPIFEDDYKTIYRVTRVAKAEV